MKQNTLADELTGVALRQMQTSYLFKVPRLNRIRQFRNLYNNVVSPQKRIRYNVPVPIFAGLIDTLNAQLDDDLILKFEERDPADWMVVQKVNAMLEEKEHSMAPGAKWSAKLRAAKFECTLTGRGFLKYNVGNEPDGYEDCLDAPTYEDMFWQPKGGGNLENHLFRGQMNIWKTKQDILDGAKAGIYDKEQVKKLTTNGGSEYIISPMWENYDFANRFLPLGLSPEANNYVGEEMFMFVEWELMHKGQYFYIVFEPYTLTWIRFEKLTDVCSGGYSHWMSFASHEDPKNFASKGFSDDLYPVATMMQDHLNEQAENIRRMNSGARAYDKDMFPDVQALDLAMTARDRLVPVDTKGGTRQISTGIFEFKTPDISGVANFLPYLEQLAGRNLGVNTAAQPDPDNQPDGVGIALQQNAGASRRLSFQAQPIIEVGQELGLRVFCGLKDYLDEPLAIKMLGEDGYQWDTLKRSELNVKRDFAIMISSENQENQMNEMAAAKKQAALQAILQPKDPGFEGNKRTVDEYRLRSAGFNEQEIRLLLDPNTQATKQTLAQVAADIETLMQGKVPDINYAANAYYFSQIFDFISEHQGDPKVKKNLKKFYNYLMSVAPIAQKNEQRRAQDDIQSAQRGAALKAAGQMPLTPSPNQKPNQSPNGTMPNAAPSPSAPQPTAALPQ